MTDFQPLEGETSPSYRDTRQKDFQVTNDLKVSNGTKVIDGVLTALSPMASPFATTPMSANPMVSPTTTPTWIRLIATAYFVVVTVVFAFSGLIVVIGVNGAYKSMNFIAKHLKESKEAEVKKTTHTTHFHSSAVRTFMSRRACTRSNDRHRRPSHHVFLSPDLDSRDSWRSGTAMQKILAC